MLKLVFICLLSLLLPRFSWSGILSQANELYENGKLTQAIPLYKKASLSGENPAICYFNLANAYFQLDSIPQSIVYYQATTSFAPDFFRGHLNLAISYYTLDDIGGCIASVKRALKIEPENEKALMLLAASYRKIQANSEAIVIFERLIKLYPQNDESYIAIAEIYRELLDNEEALNWLSRYPESGKNETYVNLLQAEIFETTGKLDKALYHLIEAFSKDSSNKWILYRIVSIYEDIGNDLVALEEAGKGLEIFPQFGELAVLAGNIAFKHQKYHDAEWFYTIAKNNGVAGGFIGLENLRSILSSDR